MDLLVYSLAIYSRQGSPPMSNSTIPSYPWSPLDTRPPCCEPRPILLTENLGVSYRGKLAFENVSLPIHRGCLTALVGPSGCGKSSFLNALNRLTNLMPQCQVFGKVRLSHEDIFAPNYDVTTLRKRVGMIFQKPNPFPLSIKKNITLPLKENGIKSKVEQENRC